MMHSMQQHSTQYTAHTPNNNMSVKRQGNEHCTLYMMCLFGCSEFGLGLLAFVACNPN